MRSISFIRESRTKSRRSRAASTAEVYAASDASTSRAIVSRSRCVGTGISISPRFLAESDLRVVVTVIRLASCARPWADVRKYQSQWPIPVSGCFGRTTSIVIPATVLDTSGGTRTTCTDPARAVTSTS